MIRVWVLWVVFVTIGVGCGEDQSSAPPSTTSERPVVNVRTPDEVTVKTNLPTVWVEVKTATVGSGQAGLYIYMTGTIKNEGLKPVKAQSAGLVVWVDDGRIDVGFEYLLMPTSVGRGNEVAFLLQSNRFPFSKVIRYDLEMEFK